MRLIFGLVLIMGIGLAGFAAYSAHQYISQQQAALAAARAQQAPAIETVGVLIAREPLRYGQRLERSHVARVAWPANALPEGVFTDVEALFPENATGPRVVMRAMERNEPIMAVKVGEPGQDAGITSRLSPGMRAFTIRVDVTSGVSGFLRPGDTVDVYWSGRTSNGEITRLIEQGVKLIAVDQLADEDRRSAAIIARNVTAEVTPQQVAALAQAQSTGRLSLALVGAMDDSRAEVIEVNQRSLLGIVAEEAPAAVERAPVCSVRTRRGSEVVTIEIPCTN